MSLATDRDGNVYTEGDVLLRAGKTIKVNGADALGKAKVYRANLFQTGSDAPVAVVLENTLGGEVVWVRESGGDYRGVLAGAFPPERTLCLPYSFNDLAVSTSETFHLVSENGDLIRLCGADADLSAIGFQQPLPICVYVYPES